MLHQRYMRIAALCASLLAGVADAQPGASPLDATVGVTSKNLEVKGIQDDWLSYNGDYTGRRYVSLSQVTPQNVAQLRAQWVFHSRNAGTLEVTPIVVAGIMYVTGSNDAYAIQATTGQVLWHHSRQITEGLVDDASGLINRGVAVLGTRLYMETDNAHLLCLDARSGNLLWDVAYAPGNKNYR